MTMQKVLKATSISMDDTGKVRRVTNTDKLLFPFAFQINHTNIFVLVSMIQGQIKEKKRLLVPRSTALFQSIVRMSDGFFLPLRIGLVSK